MAVPERRFAQALNNLCGDWTLRHACPLIASGMIGSRQGWHEAPYLECPAALAQAAAQHTRIDITPRATLHIVPGLHCIGADGQSDVMRGEETQLWGAALPAGTCCVLPGTRSKWAWMGEGAEIAGFQTYLTGELYSVLAQHSILGRGMQFGQERPAAFDA
jgi:2-dehydro-3-deoxygalactonokinase